MHQARCPHADPHSLPLVCAAALPQVGGEGAWRGVDAVSARCAVLMARLMEKARLKKAAQAAGGGGLA